MEVFLRVFSIQSMRDIESKEFLQQISLYVKSDSLCIQEILILICIQLIHSFINSFIYLFILKTFHSF
jgi:hypothetical protein